MKINDAELDIDFTDADQIDKIEKAADKVRSMINPEKPKEMSMAEFIKGECQIIRDFFDEAFGEGTSEKIFGNRYSLSICVSAFQQIIEAKLAQQDELDKIISKYSPERLK